jgi:hypothetical protein
MFNLHRWFRQSKLTSFQRQLNLYGFSRLTAGQDRGGYYHELFLRGRPDLCKRMVRTRIKGNGSKAAASPETEPNFYAMDPIPSSVPTTTTADNAPTPTRKHKRVVTIEGSTKKQDILMDIVVDDQDEEFNEILSGDDGIILPQDVFIPSNAASQEDGEGRLTPLAATTSEYKGLANDGAAVFATSALSPISSYSSIQQAAVPAVVTPMAESRPTASLSQQGLAALAPPFAGEAPIASTYLLQPQPLLSSEQGVLDGDCDTTVHSGDRVLFEGLPFHYLETKDVEDSLHILQAAEV